MKNIMTIVMSLILWIGLTQNTMSQNYWPTGDTIDVFSGVNGCTFNVCYHGHGVWFKSGPVDNAGWYDWAFQSGSYSTYIAYYDPATEGDFWYYINHNSGHGNISFYINFVMPVTSSQSITICAGDSYTIGTHTYTTAGTYVDTIPAVNTCDSIVTTNLTINDVPTVSFAVDTITVGSIQPVTLTPTITDADTYLWSTGETTPSIVADTVGWFYVTVSNNCGSAIDSILIRLSTNVPETADDGAIPVQICPNPVTDFIHFLGYTDGIEQVEIYNQIGQCVMAIVDKKTLTSINVSMLSKGVYYIKLDIRKGNAKPIMFLKE